MTSMLSIEKLVKSMENHPIFAGMEPSHIQAILTQCPQKQYEFHENILTAFTPRTNLIFVLEGAAEVYAEVNSDHIEVFETIEVGGVIGLSGLSRFMMPVEEDLGQKDDYHVFVRATERTCCLFIPYTIIQEQLEKDPLVARYLLSKTTNRLKDVYTSLAEQLHLAHLYGESEPYVVRVYDMMTKALVTASPTMMIKELAERLVEKRISSVVVVENNQLLGIVTEKDLVSRVLATGISPTEQITTIMTEKVETIEQTAYYYEALFKLVLNGIKHLPVMNGDQIVGMVTLSDLLQKKNSHQIKTIQQIETATKDTLPNIKEAIYGIFGTLMKRKVPILQTLDVVTTLYDRLVHRSITLAVENLKSRGLHPPVPFCFYQMGSSGRKEQFLVTDQDHFLVYEDSSDVQEAKEYFAQLGAEIVDTLVMAGYERCKGNMMSSAAHWRGTITEWKERLRGWGMRPTEENLLLAINFLSFRHVFGDESLNDRFENSVATVLQEHTMLITQLLELEKARPVPQIEGAFRSLIGLRKKEINLKLNVLFPLHHGLQVLSLRRGKVSGTPLERIDFLEQVHAIDKSFANDLKQTFEEILQLYVTMKWAQYNQQQKPSTNLILKNLSTREREQLMISLRTIRDLQKCYGP